MKIPSLLRDRLTLFPWKWALVAFCVALPITVMFQYLGGVYASELGGHPDEPAHYVTGLMIRDYLASGFHSGPMTYAKDYYDHYPKVALGNWPPFFYMIQSAWTLPFSPSHASVLRLMAVLTALLAAGVPEKFKGQDRPMNYVVSTGSPAGAAAIDVVLGGSR